MLKFEIKKKDLLGHASKKFDLVSECFYLNNKKSHLKPAKRRKGANDRSGSPNDFSFPAR